MLRKTLQEEAIYPAGQYLGREGEWHERLTGKLVLFDRDGNIAVIGRTAHGYLTLPGGGIDAGETLEQGTLRECREETGCTAVLVDKLGIVDDYRHRDMRHCVTHCYRATVVGEKGVPSPMPDEAESGMHVRWLPVDEARALFARQVADLRAGRVAHYNTGFNIYRDYLFLLEA